MGVGNYVLVENINGTINVIFDSKTGEILVFTSKEEADMKTKEYPNSFAIPLLHLKFKE